MVHQGTRFESFEFPVQIRDFIEEETMDTLITTYLYFQYRNKIYFPDYPKYISVEEITNCNRLQ